MTDLNKALEACRQLLTRKGRGPRPSIDWEKVIRTFFECNNQHTTAARLGLRQSRVSTILRRCGVHLGRGKRKPIHALPMAEVARQYRAGSPTTELGRLYEVDPEVIRRRLRTAGVQRRPRGQFERRGSDHPQWKGGYEPPMHYHRRQAYEVAAICLGQPLPQGWIVHHVDENPKNNEPSNLLLFRNQSAHCCYHQRLLEIQAIDPQADATLVALANGAEALPIPPRPIVLPPCTDAPVPSRRKQKPASRRPRCALGQFQSDPQPESPR